MKTFELNAGWPTDQSARLDTRSHRIVNWDRGDLIRALNAYQKRFGLRKLGIMLDKLLGISDPNSIKPHARGIVILQIVKEISERPWRAAVLNQSKGSEDA